MTDQALLLYDCRRDGEIKLDEFLVLYENGTTVRVPKVKDNEPAVASPTQQTSWSKEGQVYYVDGYAYGINDELKTICLGREVDVRAAVVNPKTHSGNPDIDAIINSERNILKGIYQTEVEIHGRRIEGIKANLRACKPERPGNLRIRLVRDIRHKRLNPGRLKAHKAVAVCPTQPE